MPSVDVIIPCYQYGRFLRACVTSVFQQKLDNIRILIIDNASTDDSVLVAQQLVEEDSRIQLIARDVNLGPQASFNQGVDWATSEYMIILCADDLLTPGALDRAVSIMERNPSIAFAYGEDVEYRDGEALPEIPQSAGDDWKVISGPAFAEERCRNPAGYIAAGAVVARTAIHKKAGHYRPELPYTDDLEIMLRMAVLGDVAKTNAVQGIRRLHQANMSSGFLKAKIHDLLQREAAFECFFAREGHGLANAAALRRLSRHSLAERAYWWAVRDAFGRRMDSSRDLFKFAFRLSPRSAYMPPVNFLFREDGPYRRIRQKLIRLLHTDKVSNAPADLEKASKGASLQTRH